VIIVICILLLLGLLTTHLQAQRSLRWWHLRQSMKLRREAEEIRNGLLQESFVLRRNLEMFHINQGEQATAGEPSRDCLETMEKFHRSLKELSDRLSLPFIDESLPQAIQHLLESWQLRYPAIAVNASLPAEWVPDRYEHRRAILMVLDDLCQITLSELSTLDSIMVSLQQKGQTGRLITQFAYSSPSTLSPHLDLSNLKYLQPVFPFLTPGNCSYQCTDSTLTWYFDWKLTDTQPE
jgi:hypothetical protein